jgi:hypothetical protein
MRRTGTKAEKRPETEWIMLPDATQPIIDRELFDMAQGVIIIRHGCVKVEN